MKRIGFSVFPFLFLLSSLSTQELKTATGHPMQYYISLPKGWTKDKAWPIVILNEAAEKQYKENAKRFISARNDMPFILVAPIHVNNGNQGRHDPEVFPYSDEAWNYIDKVGDCKFNEDGISQIIRDVQKEYHGEQKYFITGFEAGAHTTWAMIFSHPENLRGAAVIDGNFRGRCTDAFSTDPSRVNLPVCAFQADIDSLEIGKILQSQWLDAKKLAIEHGFKNLSEKRIYGKGHIPMPDEVLAYFFEILNSRKD